MKAIGGYFELECGCVLPYYSDGIYLNLCRSALRYLIRVLGISKLYVPYYTCDVVYKAIEQERCIAEKYHLNTNMMPDRDFEKNAFIVYNNYFGVLGKKVRELAKIYPNLIVDNAQAFYSNTNCRASIYSPRKFFGLPDGGILRGKDIPILDIEKGISYNLCSHLLERIDMGAEFGYQEFVKNDKFLEELPLNKMSRLTNKLMRNIDYNKVRKRRLENFRVLQESLSTNFPISMSEDDVPMVYPFYINDGSRLKEKLINNKIFCATYWPNVFDSCSSTSVEFNLAKNLILLPIDQRYGEEEMKRILKLLSYYG